MAVLQCSADSCMYQKENLCCKGEILVGGKHADCSGKTCCESFTKRRLDRLTSSMSHPSETIIIDCEAANCRHNKNYKCTAKNVDIRGVGASDSKETSCSTFEER